MALTTPVSEIVEKSNNPLLGKAESWGRVLLGDIATIQNGFAFKSSLFTKDGGMPLIRIRDVGKASSNTYYDGEYDPSYVVEAGDLLIGMDGDFNCARWRGPNGLLNQRVCRINITADIYHPKLLDYALPGYLKAINEMTSSITVKHLSSKTISEIPLPLPPMEQQKRIVAEIEKQFSRLDEAVANLKRVKANLKRYKAAVLKAAVEGKLTEEWRKQHPNVEPASKLLERILTERREKWEGAELAKMKAKGKAPDDDKWKKKYEEPAKPDTTGLSDLPAGWVWASLEAVSDAIGGFAFKSKEFTENGHQIVKMANIKMGKLDLSQRPSYIEEVPEDIIEKYQIVEKDILVTLTGTRKKRDYGYVVQIKEPENSLLLNQRIARLRPYMPDTSGFVTLALQSEVFRELFFEHETGNVGQGNVGMKAVTTESIPLPPLDEQTDIIEEYESKLSVVIKTEGAVETSMRRAERLKQSILSKAFSGVL